MGHYAKVVSGEVVQVIVAEPEFFNSFVDTSPGEWIQTSYNTRGGVHYVPNSNPPEPSEDQSKALRKNYAGLGFTYDREKDAFIPPKPYPSWVLDETSCLWEAPTPMPTDGYMYQWVEANTAWEQTASEPHITNP
jgi:hypothetical protein